MINTYMSLDKLEKFAAARIPVEEDTTDCREQIGMTVGLIDSLIFIARAARRSDLTSDEVKEALRDLQDDEDIEYLLSLYKVDK